MRSTNNDTKGSESQKCADRNLSSLAATPQMLAGDLDFDDIVLEPLRMLLAEESKSKSFSKIRILRSNIEAFKKCLADCASSTYRLAEALLGVLNCYEFELEIMKCDDLVDGNQCFSMAMGLQYRVVNSSYKATVNQRRIEYLKVFASYASEAFMKAIFTGLACSVCEISRMGSIVFLLLQLNVSSTRVSKNLLYYASKKNNTAALKLMLKYADIFSIGECKRYLFDLIYNGVSFGGHSAINACLDHPILRENILPILIQYLGPNEKIISQFYANNPDEKQKILNRAYQQTLMRLWAEGDPDEKCFPILYAGTLELLRFDVERTYRMMIEFSSQSLSPYSARHEHGAEAKKPMSRLFQFKRSIRQHKKVDFLSSMQKSDLIKRIHPLRKKLTTAIHVLSSSRAGADLKENTSTQCFHDNGFFGL